MAAWGKSLLRAGVTVVVVVALLVAVAVAWLTQTAAGRATLLKVVVSEANASQFRGTLSVERATGPVFGTLGLDGVRLVDTSGQSVVAVERLEVRYGLVALLSRRVEVSSLTVDGLDMAVVAAADGSLNVEGLLQPSDPGDDAADAATAAWEVVLDRLTLSSVDVSYREHDEESALATVTIARADGRFELDASGAIAVTVGSLEGAWRYEGAGGDVAMSDVAFTRLGGSVTTVIASLDTFGVRVTGLSAAVPDGSTGGDIEAAIDAIDLDPDRKSVV